ncbi:MAG TPA: SDR family oxidoreductase [Burkholderiales bacterium]|jgi:NAD(P)-dependent dehydrogenase (short-subunit alcohol dehydrogenase family)|nr:SDR family oxidoreductase [Burkholderiales bacterium]
MKTLEGAVVLVTGGGRGLGAAICRTLAKDHATVAIADIDLERTRALAGSLESEGGRCAALQLDVRDDGEAKACVAEVQERFGRLDALINNAAVDFTLPLHELTVAQWDAVLATNLRGPFLLSKYASAIMEKQGGGHIVNITSTAAKRTWANASAYHASKWGLLGLSHALHAELRSHGIKVSAVVAGGMRTPFLLDRFPDIDPAVLQDPAHVAAAVKFILTQPEETVIPEVMVLPMRETSWP